MGFDRGGSGLDIGGMAKTEEETERAAAAREILDVLEALPPGTKLSNQEVFALLSKLPPRPRDWTSADVIREMRGPLPEDDPLFDDRRR